MGSPAVAPGPARARVVVVGNPNTGKSSLFNALTGGRARVGNFAGTTVSTSRGTLELDGVAVDLVDVPGAYSLTANSPDERAATDAIVGTGRSPGPPDAAVVVLDGPRLLRSLYFALQVLELGLPVVVAVNLLDEARAQGLTVALGALSEALGVPVVGTVARTGEGLPELREALAAVLRERRPSVPPHAFPTAVDADVDAVVAMLPAAWRGPRERALARWVLLSADAEGALPGGERFPIVAELRARAAASGRDPDAELVTARYAWIDAREAGFLGRGPSPADPLTERLDRVLLHPLLGSAAFVAVMALAFVSLFAWADPLVGAIEGVQGWLGDTIRAGSGLLVSRVGLAGPLGLATDLVVDGVVGGVGSVVVFLPQVALLFFFLALLEDCGYLSRAAHLADRLLRLAGLPGKAFVPLLSGYACAVPAILATRTLPRERDRLVTMLVLPLTSCSARLPVYTLVVGALFPPVVLGLPARPLALAGMYLFSTALAVGASLVLGSTVLREDARDAVLLELPPYRLPNPRVVVREVASRCGSFLREAGGTILAATLVLWALTTFPRYEPEDLLPADVLAEAVAAGEDPEELAAPLALERSFAGRIGHAIEPVVAPLGYDWKMSVGLLGAFAAREVFVSTLGVVYGVADADEESGSLRDRMRASLRPDGSPTYTPLVGASLMVFFAVALQCLSTVAVLRRETGGWRWPIVSLAWTFALAWILAFGVYQGGRALGLG